MLCPPGANDPFRALLQRLGENLQRAAGRVNELECELVDVRNELDDLTAIVWRILADPRALEALEGDLRRTLEGIPRTPGGARAGGAHRLLEDALLEKARQGVEQITVHFRDEGNCEVIIDGQSIEMSGKLGRLLELLAADTGVSKDHLVSWKQGWYLCEQLGERFGEEAPSIKALNNLVWRLRHALQRAGWHQEVVQRDKKRGLLRFAIKRGAEGDSSALRFPLR